MDIKVSDYLSEAKHSLNYWEDKLKEVQEGTYEYDGTIPNSCWDALCERKVAIFKEAVSYLSSLPTDKVLSTSVGLTKEAVEYYSIVNR